MSVYKDFTFQDVTIAPFNVNKSYTFTGINALDPNNSIGIYYGINSPNIYNIKERDTGIINRLNSTLLYHSIKQLYYSNYYESPSGSKVTLPELIPGITPEDNTYIGSTQSPLFDNYLQNTLLQDRYFPTHLNAEISILSIPSKLYGDYVVPNSFEFIYPNNSNANITFLKDDGEGNIVENSKTFNITRRYKNNNTTNNNGYFILTDGEGNNSITFTDITNILININTPVTTILNGKTSNTNAYRGHLNYYSNTFSERDIFLEITDSNNPLIYFKFKITNVNSILTDSPLNLTVEPIESKGDLQELLHKNTYNITHTLPPILDYTIGHIFYPHGIVTFTSGNFATASREITFIGGVRQEGGIYPNLPLVNISYSSSLTLYENQYKCTVRENEFQYTLNPSALSGDSNEFYYDFITGSDFKPYVSTVGLYNKEGDLLVTGKLSQPIPLSKTTDTTFQINFDFSFPSDKKDLVSFEDCTINLFNSCSLIFTQDCLGVTDVQLNPECTAVILPGEIYTTGSTASTGEYWPNTPTGPWLFDDIQGKINFGVIVQEYDHCLPQVIFGIADISGSDCVIEEIFYALTNTSPPSLGKFYSSDWESDTPILSFNETDFNNDNQGVLWGDLILNSESKIIKFFNNSDPLNPSLASIYRIDSITLLTSPENRYELELTLINGRYYNPAEGNNLDNKIQIIYPNNT